MAVLFSWQLQNGPTILIFSIAIDVEYVTHVKSIATFAPTFYGYIISVLASVKHLYDLQFHEISHNFSAFEQLLVILGQFLIKFKFSLVTWGVTNGDVLLLTTLWYMQRSATYLE